MGELPVPCYQSFVSEQFDNLVLVYLRRIDAVTGELRADLSRLEAGQTELRADIASLKAGQTELRADITRLEAGQTELRADITRLEAGQTALRADMTARMDRLEAALAQTRIDFLEELGATRGVLIARLDRLQARIDQLQEECFVAFAQGETVRRISDNTRAESHDLAEQVSGLVRQVRMLPTRIDQIEGP